MRCYNFRDMNKAQKHTKLSLKHNKQKCILLRSRYIWKEIRSENQLHKENDAHSIRPFSKGIPCTLSYQKRKKAKAAGDHIYNIYTHNCKHIRYRG
mmetsp:Transcript_27354/g.43288  ORF Transcript_27354/g.43288 Transcript_27354/m.43288 type:complete len:96 (+) Transcript_27354:165-452(+)